MKKLFFISIVFCLVGCGSNTGNTTPEKTDKSTTAVKTADSTTSAKTDSMTVEKPDDSKSVTIRQGDYLYSLDSISFQNSLVHLIENKAFSENSELFVLLDRLFLHVQSESFPATVRREERWMSNYRHDLSVYYDSHALGSGSISDYAKSDSVLNQGLRLMERGGNFGSTYGMSVFYSVNYSFDRCREYGLLNEMVSKCKDENAKNLVYREWQLYEQMLKKVRVIFDDLTDMKYWGGSISGMKSSEREYLLVKARVSMYQKVLGLMSGEEGDKTGAYLRKAKRFFFDSYETSLKETISMIEHYYREYEERDPNSSFYEKEHEAQAAAKELRPILDEWIKTVEKLNEESASFNHPIEQAASSILMEWASILSAE
ncbi:MAG: hypothetical protein IJP70_01425 [Bacteroidales bacterium]|nr:hypothetical protein [Bacteroidales bacterium]